MKARVSITVEKDYLEALQRAGRQENRSLSNQIESNPAEWLRKRPIAEQILRTPGRFVGKFSREDTYADD